MANTITGQVKNGVVIPNTPLPEGSIVEIHVKDGLPELEDELAAWQQLSAEAMALVEGTAQDQADEKG